MSNVKNSSNDPFAALGRLGESLLKEGGRVVEERVRHVTEDIDSVNQAVKTGGFVGGAVQLYDVASIGHQLAHNVDSIIPGEDLPPSVKEGVALGVNVLTGNPIALKDAFDLYNAMSSGSAAPPSGGAPTSGAQAGQKMQTPESPSTALERAKEQRNEIRDAAKKEAIKEAKEKARAAALEKAQGNRITELEHRVTILEELAGVGSGFSFDDVELGGDTRNDSRMRKFEKDLEDANREIDRILSNPNLAFEDLIFLLMRAVIKQSESETKLSLQQEKATRDSDRSMRDAGRAEISGLQSQLNATLAEAAKAPADQKEGIQAKAAELRAKIDDKQTRLTDQINDRTESRSERFEELKESLQKLSEMQQALSNIMNSLHQTAMNAIGNIR